MAVAKKPKPKISWTRALLIGGAITFFGAMLLMPNPDKKYVNQAPLDERIIPILTERVAGNYENEINIKRVYNKDCPTTSDPGKMWRQYLVTSYHGGFLAGISYDNYCVKYTNEEDSELVLEIMKVN